GTCLLTRRGLVDCEFTVRFGPREGRKVASVIEAARHTPFGGSSIVRSALVTFFRPAKGAAIGEAFLASTCRENPRNRLLMSDLHPTYRRACRTGCSSGASLLDLGVFTSKPARYAVAD